MSLTDVARGDLSSLVFDRYLLWDLVSFLGLCECLTSVVLLACISILFCSCCLYLLACVSGRWFGSAHFCLCREKELSIVCCI